MNFMFPQMNVNMNNNMNYIKGIKNYCINEEASYVNSVLQSLSCLDCIVNWFNNINKNAIMNNMQSSLTKEFYSLLTNLYSGQNADSSNIIFHFNNKLKQFWGKEVKNDPYRFLHYFLEIEHYENNIMLNPNFNMNLINNPSIENMRNDQYMYYIFGLYFQQVQNSFISQSFYNVEKCTFRCVNCLPLFHYSHRKIFVFEVEKYKAFRDEAFPNQIGCNLELDDCIKCYIGDTSDTCGICQNPNGTSNKTIISTSKVLIIYFKRNQHIFKGDINIKNKLMLLNKNYTLKACISYCNMPKYFCDVCIKGVWYRYMDNEVKMLGNVFAEIHDFEPQILIYELENLNNNNQFYLNPFNNNINQMMMNNKFNINFTPMQQFQNLLRQQQMKQQLLFQQNMYRNFWLMSTLNTVANNFNNNNNNSNHATLNFLLIPKNWNQSEENIIKIMPQVTLEDTVQLAIDKFFTKLVKPRQAISEFKFNNCTIDVSSTQKLRDIGITNNSKIYAIKSDNFDQLHL